MTDIIDELRNGQKPMQVLGGQYMSITAGPSIFERAAAEIERLRAALEVAYNGLLNGHLNDAAEMDEITARVGGALKQSDEAAWRRVAFGNEQEAVKK